MKIDLKGVRDRIKKFDFGNLFVEELGWNRISTHPLHVEINGLIYTLQAKAEKCDMVAYLCDSAPGKDIPEYKVRRKIEKEVAKTSKENILIFTDTTKTRQSWLWVKREAGQPDRGRRHEYSAPQSGESLAQKLHHLAISLEEEEKGLSIVQVLRGVRKGFDVEKATTRKFFDRYSAEHKSFLAFINGIPNPDHKEWYASVMFNRLMFIYFIQKKGFLDSDADYLRNRLEMSQKISGKDQFHSFYRHFLLRLFHEGLGNRNHSTELDELIGHVPYLNGGLFDVHELEKPYQDIQIPDEAFIRLFRFFDEFHWHLDERPIRKDDEINPDVLGYIFEKYINNQYEMGAYYTKEDITGYISQNTIIPALFNAAAKDCPRNFYPDSPIWALLVQNPDRYLYPHCREGVIDNGKITALPSDISEGFADSDKRRAWNRTAIPPFTSHEETWREYIGRRERCLKIRAELAAGRVKTIDDLVTLNLHIRQFALDVVENTDDSELLQTFYLPFRTSRSEYPRISGPRSVQAS